MKTIKAIFAWIWSELTKHRQLGSRKPVGYVNVKTGSAVLNPNAKVKVKNTWK